MRRALQLAKNGAGRTLSNPLVGAVIVSDGQIIGEGWHRRYGGPHAEVNAVNSVKESDREKLKNSTIYVTLEPCSHYGKTPPCANLLIDCEIPRIVVGALDPFPKVSGRGIRMLQAAGREVITGVLENECIEINRRFMTAHQRGYPYIQLKWAQTSDGYLSAGLNQPTLQISNQLSMMWMHKERAKSNAIFAGTNTILSDNPSLTCRYWPGDDPRKLTFDSPRLPDNAEILTGEYLLRKQNETLHDFLHRLYKEHNILSVMIEGGKETLQEFIEANLFDEIRVETNTELAIPLELQKTAVPAPTFPEDSLQLISVEKVRNNLIHTFTRHP